MADFSTIKGFSVKTLSSDPSLPGAAGATWASAPAINIARDNMGAAGASNTAALIFGGDGPALTPPHQASTESYNGTAWTEVADLSKPYGSLFGFGSQTSAMQASGNSPPGHVKQTTSEQWDGTSWTSAPAINTARGLGAASGTVNTAGLIFGGWFNPSPVLAITESFNGSAWTEVNDMNTTRQYFGGSQQGSSTAALAFGGDGSE